VIQSNRRRIRGEGGLYQEANGAWRGVVDLGWLNGKRIRKTVSGRTKKIAQEKFLALKAEIEKGGGLTADVSVEEWLNHWFEYIARERVRERTLQGYRSYLDVWLIPYLGKFRLNKLKEDHIRSMLRAMQDQGKSNATRRQAYAILHRSLVVAEREDRIQRNPSRIDAPKVEKNHRLPLSIEQARLVLAHLDGDPLAARWIAALLLGMRQGECLGLKWEDVDLENGVIKIRREIIRITGKGLTETPPKSKNSIRDIPILAPMAFALEKTEKRGEFVFYGEKFDPRKDWVAWKLLLMDSGAVATVPKSEWGTLPELASARTTTATLLRNAGVSDTVVRDILGHAQVQITQESYMRTDARTLKEAMKALESSVKEKKKV
jgi:integrase